MASGEALRDEGMRLYREERFEEAAAKFADAQAVFAANGRVKDAAEQANNRGQSWRQAARWDEALAAFEEARAVFQSLGDVASEGQVIGNLGALADAQGKLDQASEYYVEAIHMLESVGERDLAQATYTALSRLKLKQGNWLGAIGAFESGLTQLEKPSLTHRVVRRLLDVPRKLIGG
jgi:tetratricopeptide (TPR) repeat protein